MRSGFAPRIEAFCEANDTSCDSGFSPQVHLTYLDRYQTQAATLVLGKIGGAEPAILPSTETGRGPPRWCC